MEDVEALVVAAESGNVMQAAHLLDLGVPVDGRTRARRWPTSALGTAVLRGHTDMVRLLLRSGSDPEQRIGRHDDALPLWHAAHQGMLGIAALLLDAGADPDGRPWPKSPPPLTGAARGNHVEAAALLLERGAATGRLPGQLHPVLVEVARAGNPDILRLVQDRDGGPFRSPTTVTRIGTEAVKYRADAVRWGRYVEIAALLGGSVADLETAVAQALRPVPRPTGPDGTLRAVLPGGTARADPPCGPD
ncbi:ankyrin repeat domain-containing protein [Streptomyces sp. NPDC008150]|uniref:ankyrin repeat domain-containing protein n=1 Tax=Streptomyces sp. NPDC008150 TaxID=3364816 RepID=UPI0036EBEA22